MAKKKRDGWQQLCKLVEHDDGLPVRESGPWAAEKLWFWNRYIEITTTAMVGKPAWPAGLCYVDLFAGPGICQIKTTDERVPGSPLIAAHAPKRFERILLCEIDAKLAGACEIRLKNSPASGCYELFCGNCNEEIDRIVSAIPTGALTLAFLDPTGLHLHFDTVRRLSSHGPVDLLILFPDAIDILCNAEHYYFDRRDSNLDLVLGPDSNWRELRSAAKSSRGGEMRKLFTKIYKEQLRKLAGYDCFADEVIRGPAGPLYRLVYCSKNELGVDFWNKSVRKEVGGQKRLF